MDAQHVITVKILKSNQPLTTLQKNVNLSSIKEIIKEVRTMQKETNEYLTKLVENEKHSDGTQNADMEEDEEEDDADEEEVNPNGDASILKRKLEEHVADDKKLKI